jgi:DNA modification methylase
MNAITQANAMHIPLASRVVQTVVTSPPYYQLRDYKTAKWDGGNNPECDHSPVRKNPAAGSTLQEGKKNSGHAHEGFIGVTCPKCGANRIDDQIGLETSLEDYISNLIAVFEEVKRVLRDNGTLWVNMGDSYVTGQKGSGGKTAKQLTNAGSFHTPTTSRPNPKNALPEKNLMGVPWRFAFAMQAAGWYLRRDIIWYKTNPMPESATDRPSTTHEYIFLFTKKPNYYYDIEAVKEPAKSESLERFQRAWGGDENKYQDGEGQALNAGKRMASTKKRMGGGPFSKKYAEQQLQHGGKSRYRSQADTFNRMTNETDVPGQSKHQHRDERREDEYDLSRRNNKSLWTADEDEYHQFLAWKAQRMQEDVWTIACNGFKGAHFATFPEKLVEPCILAGTSAKGCCPECRSPYKRIVKRITTTQARNAAGKHYDGTQRTQVTSRKAPGEDFHDLGTISTQTIGWKPTCTCNAGDPIPCLVLDPFSGSGTTGRVATRTRRDYFGTELSWKYIQMKGSRMTLQIDSLDLLMPTRQTRKQESKSQETLNLIVDFDPEHTHTGAQTMEVSLIPVKVEKSNVSDNYS